MAQDVELVERKKNDPKKSGIEYYMEGRQFLEKHEYQKAAGYFIQSHKAKYYLASFWLYQLYNSPFYLMQNNLEAENWKLIAGVHLLPFLFSRNGEQDRLLIIGYLHQYGMFGIKKNRDEAIKCYDLYEILLQRKEDVFLSLFRADLEFDEGNYELAQQQYNKILAIDNRFSPALNGHALCQQRVVTDSKLIQEFKNTPLRKKSDTIKTNENKYSSPTFFSVVESPSLIYPSKKISRSNCLIMLACKITDVNNLKWEKDSNLFLEYIDGEGSYILERYYLKPNSISAPMCTRKVNRDSLAEFYFSPKHVFEINKTLGSEIVSHLRLNNKSKQGTISHGSHISTLCQVKWNSLIWCTQVMEKFHLETPSIKELPDSVAKVLGPSDVRSCIIA